MRLATKIATLTISVVAVLAVALGLAAYVAIARESGKQVVSDLLARQVLVQSEVDQMAARVRQIAALTADRADVISSGRHRQQPGAPEDRPVGAQTNGYGSAHHRQ